MLEWEREQALLRALERRYNADQPRVPPGTPDGGQWLGNNGSHASGRRQGHVLVGDAKPPVTPAAEPSVPPKRPQLGSPELPATTSDHGVLAADPSRNPTYNGIVIRDPVTASQPNLPKDAKPLLAPNGQQAFNPNSGSDGKTPQFVYFPQKFPPEYFISNGERISSSFQINPMGYDVEVLTGLIKFGQNGVWDTQRQHGILISAYVDYATVAIGLWGAAVQVPEDSLLRVENAYARLFSRFSSSAVMDSEYRNLPLRNVTNTGIGYILYKNKYGR